jgi:hypothetical protein
MTVTVYDVRSQRASTSNVNVYVAASTLVAAVSGGLSKSVRQLTSFSVDGSISYDNDQKNQGNSGLLFSWTCVQTAPSFSSSCGVGIDASSASSMVLTGTSTALSTTSSITLVVSDGAGRSATLAVSLGVLSASAPIVTMLTAAPPKINVNTVLYLSASTQLIGSGQLTWTVSDSSLDLSSLSPVSPVSQYTPSVATSAGSTAYSNLILPANTLPPNSVLTFTLTCVSPSSTVAGTSSIVIVTNGPPVPGVFAVSPTSGEELKSTFRFLATTWTDPDTPLTYSFGFQVSSSSPYLEVQSKSQQTYGSSLLPAGLSSNNQLVTCIANIFDSYSANTSAYFSVAVDKMTVNASALSSLVANQLSSSSGDADGTKQAISTLSSVLNSVNCSGAPHCASLNREGCSSVANTCGPCLSGGLYVGASGNSNRPCVSLASIVSSSSSSSSSNATSGSKASVGSSAGSACKSDGTCNGWLSCNAVTKLCYMPSKSCSVSDCNGQGSCGFIAVSTGFAVSSCTADDVTCEATCTCASGFSGDSCEYSAEELLSKQAIRMQLSESLVSLMSLENPDNEVIIGWANSASAITQNAYEISTAAGALTLNASAQIISSASGNGVNYAAISQVLGSVDNVVTAATSYSSRRRLALASISASASASASSSVVSGSCPKDMLMSFASLASASMVAGQTPTQSVSTNFRLAASVFDMSTSSTAQLGIPVSSLEAAYNQQQSSVSFSGAASTSFAMSAVSLRASAFSTSNFDCPQNVNLEPSALHANPVRVSLVTSALTCDATNPKREIRFSLHNNEVQYYGNVTGTNSSSANTTVFTTTCTSGLVANFTYQCSNGLSVTVRCDGKAGVWKSRCPILESYPSCVLLSSSSGLADISCHVVNYTSTVTTCSCTLCDLSTDGDVRRRLDVISGSGVMELSTIASFAGKDFASTMESASSFTSLAAIKSSVLVIATFGGLWLGMLAVGLLSVKFEKAALRPKAGAVLDEPKQLRDSSGLQENIIEYIDLLLPVVYSTQSRSRRLLTQVLYHHQYLKVAAETGVKKWIHMLEILTNLTANMFLLALFYDIQWPSDDGACALITTETGCVARKSYFDSAENMCTWVVDSGVCVWMKPSYNPNILVFISVLVVGISAPIYFVLSYLFNKVLLAPTLDDLNQDMANNHRRRQSAVSLVNSAAQNGSKRRRAVHNKRRGPSGGLVAAEEEVGLFHSTSIMSESVSVGRRQAHIATQTLGLKEVQAFSRKDSVSIEKEITLLDLSKAVCRQLSEVGGRDKAAFRKLWPADLFEPSFDKRSAALTVCSPESVVDNPLQQMDAELRLVQTEADEWIGKLKKMSTAHVGVHIMTLFMKDLLGRDSAKAKIFMHQMNTISQERVITWGLKCMGFSFVIIFNLYFVYTCMLYGHSKGMEWQQGWLIASAVNLVLDIFIKQSNIAAIVYYVIPDLIVDSARSVRVNLEKSISAMCVNASRGQLHKIDSINPHSFSASNYFFVSARVARAFPGLLESAIVLSYQSPTVSAELREKWGLQRHTSHKSGLWRQLWTFMQDLDFASILSLLTTTVLMSLGAQALIVQRVVVTSLNPAIIAVIAYVGSFILNRPLLGTLIVVGGLSVLFAVWFVYWRSHNASNKTHAIAVDDQKLNGIVPENYIPARNTAYRNVAAEFATLKKHLIQIQNEDDGDSVDYETMAATLRQIARGSSADAGADVSASSSEDDYAIVKSLGALARCVSKSPCSDAESKHCDEFSVYSSDGGSRASSPNDREELSPYVIVHHAQHESLTPCTQNPIAMDAHSSHRYSVLKNSLKDIAAQDDGSDEIMSNSSISICLAELAPDSKQSSVFSSDSGSSSSDDECYLANSTAETVSPASAQWERLMQVASKDLDDGNSEVETKNGTDMRSLDSLYEQEIDHHSSSAASDHQVSDDIADELDSTGLPTGRSLQTIIHRHSVVSGLLARIAREVDSEDDEDDEVDEDE